MRDVDALLRAMETPRAPREPPPWPAPRRWSVVWAVAAAVAALALVLWASRPEIELRGTPESVESLDLRMVIERAGTAVRLSRGSRAGIGERVLFRASAERPTRARLWVDGPDGAEPIITIDLDGSPRDVGNDSGLVGYRFESPGRYVFHLTPASGSCADCPAIPVEVR